MLRRFLPDQSGAIPSGGVMLTSMTDMIFLLLVFLLFAPIGQPEGQMMASSLSGDTGGSHGAKTVWVTVRAEEDGRIVYRVDGGVDHADRASLRAALIEQVERADQPVRVVVDAGPGTTFAHVVLAWDESRQAGVADLVLRE